MQHVLASVAGGFGVFSVWVWFAFLWLNAAPRTPEGYVVGSFCIWDALALGLLGGAGAVHAFRTTDTRRSGMVLFAAFSWLGLFGYVFFAGHPGSGLG